MELEVKTSQWHILGADKWVLSCLTWIPILLALSIWWIFSQGIARDLPFGVVDLEHSSLSRMLTRELDATSSLRVNGSYPSPEEARQAMINGDIYGFAVIPKNYKRDIYQGNPPQVTVFYNSQYVLIGRLVNSAVQQAHGTFNAQAGVLKQLSKGNVTTASAMGRELTITNQITPLFNRNTNYAQFLVSAIVPALWQIVVIVATILVLTANHRVYGLRVMLGKYPLLSLIRINSFYIPIYLLMGFGFLSWFYGGLDWPIQGSMGTLVYAQLITVLACVIMGSFFYLLTLDPARSLSFAGAFTAPSFAFMGVTFPVSDMSSLAQIWRSLLPISHYIEAHIGQVSYGVTSWQTISQFTPDMTWYLIPMLLTYPLCRKHLNKLGEKA